MNGDAPLIYLENADVYRDGQAVLHQLNWVLPYGRHSFILGANGSGKTTLVRLLLGHLYPRLPGKAVVLGYRFGHDDLSAMRRQIGLVSPIFSELAQAESSVLELVLSGFDGTFGLFRVVGDAEKRRAREIMACFSIGHLADRQYCRLSSGEQIRVLICRALIGRPRLLILDEPSVYLDPAGREQLLETLSRLMRESPELTILFVTQRIEDILPEFSAGLLLADGRILFAGSRHELLTPEKLSRTFKVKLQLVSGRNRRRWSFVE